MHARGNVHETAMNDPNKQPGMEMVRLFWIPPTLGRVETNGSAQGSTAVRVFEVPLAPADLGNTPTATPSPSVEPLVWDVEHRIALP